MSGPYLTREESRGNRGSLTEVFRQAGKKKKQAVKTSQIKRVTFIDSAKILLFRNISFHQWKKIVPEWLQCNQQRLHEVPVFLFCLLTLG